MYVSGRDQDPEAVNSQNDAGYTALHHAAKHGSKELIDILVKAGADQMIENNAGETPYMVAHKYQQWDAERLLLNAEQQHGKDAWVGVRGSPVPAVYSGTSPVPAVYSGTLGGCMRVPALYQQCTLGHWVGV